MKIVSFYIKEKFAKIKCSYSICPCLPAPTHAESNRRAGVENAEEGFRMPLPFHTQRGTAERVDNAVKGFRMPLPSRPHPCGG
ncbi:MAG: hypothetical protein LBC13_00510 [Clostridiales bacterium]|nr:hypothetical protein [Clostridiales bacterium]